MTRVCLDSNVWVAAFAARGLCEEVVRRCVARDEVILPGTIAEEVRRVLRKKLRLSSDQMARAEAVLERCTHSPRTSGSPPVDVQDPDDAQILADAIAADVEIFVTGDQDLLSVAPVAPISILSPRAFVMLRSHRR